MLDPAKVTLFLVASAVLVATPGPNVLYIIARSVGQGRAAGLMSVAGTSAGNLVHAIATSLGLSAVLASSALAFSVVKYAGAAYLVTTTPRLNGRTFGTNVFEAALIAARGLNRAMTDSELDEAIDELGLAPEASELNRDE